MRDPLDYIIYNGLRTTAFAEIPYYIKLNMTKKFPRGILLNSRILDLRLQGKDEEEFS